MQKKLDENGNLEGQDEAHHALHQTYVALQRRHITVPFIQRGHRLGGLRLIHADAAESVENLALHRIHSRYIGRTN